MSNYTDIINISELFEKLITFNKEENKYVMDETISSFLYYLFPRDLFIRALSLLESNNMFIYVLEKGKGKEKENNTITDDCNIQNRLIENFYKDSLHELIFLFRLIVKNQLETQQNKSQESLIYVDILHWSCSCNEYCLEILKQIESKEEDDDDDDDIDIIPNDIRNHLLIEIDDLEKFSKDKFCQLDLFSFSKQRYFKYNKVMCPHLLAYSILLISKESVLRFFIQQKKTVLLLPIDNINEWLRLHTNIII